MLGLRPFAIVTAWCLALMTWPAWAAPPVMVWPGGPQAPVNEAEPVLRAEGVTVVSRSALAQVLAGHRADEVQRQDARRGAVETALATAQEHYLSLQAPEMIGTLADAEADAAWLARPGRCDGLWELEFRLGLGLSLAGDSHDPAASTDRYALALALAPERRPLAELYGPDVTAAFLEAVKGRSAQVARPVPVRVRPEDAQVEIDCQPRAEREVDLAPGLHAVRVSAPGFAPWSGVIDLREREAVEITLTALVDDDPARRLAVSTDQDAQPDGSPSARSAIWAAAHEQGAAAVLVVDRVEGRYRVRPWGRDGIGSAVERPDLLPALQAALRLLADDGRLTTPPPVVGAGTTGPVDPEPARKPVVRTWWLWTIVGTVVATGAAVGLGLGLSRTGEPTPVEPAPGQLIIVAK